MKMKRMVALLLSLMLVGTTALAAPIAKKADNDTATVKEETVYVIADANGNPDTIIVSNWLQNKSGADVLTDSNKLDDLEVVKGDASYSIDKDNMLLWQADGEDVYYRGTAKEALPVDVTVSYLLDGKPIKAEDLAGKSGAVDYSIELGQVQ